MLLSLLARFLDLSGYATINSLNSTIISRCTIVQFPTISRIVTPSPSSQLRCSSPAQNIRNNLDVLEQPIEKSPGFPAGSNNRQFACYTNRWRPRPLFKAVTAITVMLEVVRVNAKESTYKSAFESDVTDMYRASIMKSDTILKLECAMRKSSVLQRRQLD